MVVNAHDPLGAYSGVMRSMSWLNDALICITAN